LESTRACLALPWVTVDEARGYSVPPLHSRGKAAGAFLFLVAHRRPASGLGVLLAAGIILRVFGSGSIALGLSLLVELVLDGLRFGLGLDFGWLWRLLVGHPGAPVGRGCRIAGDARRTAP
jgi:hypothetical protein